VNNPPLLLAAGLVTLALAGGLTQLVFIGLLGMLLFPGGVLLVGLALRAGRESGESPGSSLASAGAVWGGALLVAASAFQGGSLAFSVVIHRVHPGAIAPPASASAWFAGVLMALAGAALLSAGLRRYPGFSPDHGPRWFAAAASVFPVSAAIFLLLAPRLPITA
jgi:hypothetical protein